MVSVLAFLLPVPYVWRVNRQVTAEVDSFEILRQSYVQQLADADAGKSLDAARLMFEGERSRIERLEDKLAGRRAALELVLPLTLTLVGVSIGQGQAWTATIGVLAACSAALGYFATTSANSTFPFFVPGTADLVSDLASATPELHQGSRYLACCELNQPRGTILNNWVWVTHVAFAHAVVLLAAGLLILTATT
ncbi:MAG: hypothetical protein LH630_10715 [Actinomycetia bacterium]|nr:hypothetical protein [Actinomycetes bacterium]